MKKACINISIDDISPHPLSSTKVLESCYDLIKEFPDVKISLFMPVNYWRTVTESNGVNAISEKGFCIRDYPDFCNIIKSLSDDNFEVGYHGFYHGIPNVSNNDEFRYLNKRDAAKKFKKMFKTVAASGLDKKIKKIFRPPAWRMSSEAIFASKKAGFNIISLSSDKKFRKEYEKEDRIFKHVGGRKELRSGVTFFNSCPPWKPLELYLKTQIVYHACEWSPNYFGGENYSNLVDFLNKNKDKYYFGFTENVIQTHGQSLIKYDDYLKKEKIKV